MSDPSLPESFVHEDDLTTTYCIEVFAKLAGTNPQTVLHYQELGVITPCQKSKEFNTEQLRQVSRLEQLRYSHNLSDSALVLVSNLLTEIEALRHERRQLLR